MPYIRHKNRPDSHRFNGDPFVKTNDVNASQEKDPSIIEQVKLRAAETVQSFMIDMWLARQTPEKVLPILQKVIEGAKEEFADAVANGGGMYAVGYCFGGKCVLLLAADDAFGAAANQPPKDEEHAVTKEGPIIKAGALAHGKPESDRDIIDSNGSRNNDHPQGPGVRQSTSLHGLLW